MLLGLSIKGRDVNGRVNQDNAIWEKLLGAPLFEDTTMGQGISLKYLKKQYSNMTLTEDSTEDEKIIKTRCYICYYLVNFYFLKLLVIL